jgi:clathrin heavy chain
MESDRFIVVCESAAGQVAIIDLKEGNSCTRLKMSAEAAIMHPTSKIIALRGTTSFI